MMLAVQIVSNGIAISVSIEKKKHSEAPINTSIQVSACRPGTGRTVADMFE